MRHVKLCSGSSPRGMKALLRDFMAEHRLQKSWDGEASHTLLLQELCLPAADLGIVDRQRSKACLSSFYT